MFWHSLLGVAMFFGILLALIPNLLWIVAWCIGLPFGYHMPYAPFGWSAAALVVIVWMIFLCGHISDLHVDSFDRPGHLEKIFKRISDQNPDIILFTGDITTSTLDRVREREQARKRREIAAMVEAELQEQFHIPVKIRRISHCENG